MRVAHLLRKYDPRAWGGTETAVRELLSGLAQNDVDSIVFAPTLSGEVDPALDMLARDGVDVRRFGAFVPIAFASEEQKAQLVSVGGNIMSLTAPLMLASEPRLDVMHTHVLNRLGGIARLVARRRKIPLVATIHGGYLDLPTQAREQLAAPTKGGVEYGKLFGLLLKARRVLADADAIITVNPREAELLREKLPHARIERIPHGVPAARYAPDRRGAADVFMPELRGRTVLLLVGRIDSVKNQAYLVERMPEILRRHPDATLVLVGPSTDAAHDRLVRDRVRALGLADRVLLPGGLSPDDPKLIGLLQRADVFVLPSISETFGLVLLEALAAGTAVIASATSGAKQVVRHGENGYLFELDDDASFFDAIDRTLGDRDRTREMVAVGQRELREKFDTVAVAKRVRALYEDLVTDKTRRA